MQLPKHTPSWMSRAPVHTTRPALLPGASILPAPPPLPMSPEWAGGRGELEFPDHPQGTLDGPGPLRAGPRGSAQNVQMRSLLRCQEGLPRQSEGLLSGHPAGRDAGHLPPPCSVTWSKNGGSPKEGTWWGIRNRV